jgi:hypothetical protein
MHRAQNAQPPVNGTLFVVLELLRHAVGVVVQRLVLAVDRRPMPAQFAGRELSAPLGVLVQLHEHRPPRHVVGLCQQRPHRVVGNLAAALAQAQPLRVTLGVARSAARQQPGQHRQRHVRQGVPNALWIPWLGRQHAHSFGHPGHARNQELLDTRPVFLQDFHRMPFCERPGVPAAGLFHKRQHRLRNGIRLFSFSVHGLGDF